jgi:Tfp pilus assembly protein PilV
MKARLFGNKKILVQRGVSTLEILIAFSIFVLTITSAFMVIFGNQSVAVDTQTNNEALYKAQAMLEGERALARQSFLAVSTVAPATEVSGGLTYTKTITVADLTQCKKQATASIGWSDSGRAQNISFTTFLSDIAGALALGGDCATDPPLGNWKYPVTLGSANFNPDQPTGIDAFKKMVYLSSNASPGLRIFNATNGATPVLISYNNGFDAGSGLNDVDIASSTGRLYAYVAADNSVSDKSCKKTNKAFNNQFQVIDVTDPHNPATTNAQMLTLKNVDKCGSFPAGYRVYYFKDRAYITTRETAGPEFHIIDVSDPTHPSELGQGYEANRTINDFVVTEQVYKGVKSRIAYLAADASNGELTVLNVTDPENISEITSASQALAGTQNGESVYLLGYRLYFGRQSSAGDDLYVFDTSHIADATANLPIIGHQDIGSDVLGVRVAGNFAFLATSKTSNEFQVWSLDFSNPSNIAITNLAKFNFPNIIQNGLEADGAAVYATSQGNDSLRVIAPAQCSDGTDNDADGAIDAADPQCHSDGIPANALSYQPDHNDESK